VQAIAGHALHHLGIECRVIALQEQRQGAIRMQLGGQKPSAHPAGAAGNLNELAIGNRFDAENDRFADHAFTADRAHFD